MTAVPFLAGWALRSSILILSGGLLLRALRVTDPSIRLAAWTAMLCGSLAIPALTAAVPPMRLAIPRAAASPPAERSAAYETGRRPDHAVSDPSSYAEQAGSGASASNPIDWARIAWAIYVLIAGALLLRFCIGLTMSRRLLRGSRATERNTEGIEIRESDAVPGPVALGIARPVIVLPYDWREWDGAKLEAVLAHERSHIRRRDPAVQALSAIHRALLWHSPLSWFLHRRIVRVAEEASDDAAVAAIRDRASYAEALLDFMRRGMPGANWPGVAMARYGRPEERIHRILDGTALSRGVTRRSVTAILILGMPLAYLAAAAHPADAPQSAAPPTKHKPLVFDVASVKPTSAPAGVAFRGRAVTMRKGSGISIPRNTGGPGTDDPGRIHYPLISLKALLLEAYDSYFEIKSPDWLESQVVALDATMPPDTTKEQFKEMLRNLITERFGLQYHAVQKEIAGYTLVIARNGPKLTMSADQSDAELAPPTPPTSRGKDGFPILPPVTGKRLVTFGMGDRSRIIAQQEPMQELAGNLSSELKTIVTDATGLTAKYDFTLTYESLAPAPPPVNMPEALEPVPDIFSALQSQLGLKLEPNKAPVEIMVVDHMEKTPTGN